VHGGKSGQQEKKETSFSLFHLESDFLVLFRDA
jgi:hypothetical protein